MPIKIILKLNKQYIHKIMTEENKAITGDEDISKHIKNYFTQLYDQQETSEIENSF